MKLNSKSIRPFIGAKNFEVSAPFTARVGFEKVVLHPKLFLFQTNGAAFYLQDAYVKDWVDNTMVFLEVINVERHYQELAALDLPGKFPGVRLEPVAFNHGARECFLHDPSGILWHFGEFTGERGNSPMYSSNNLADTVFCSSGARVLVAIAMGPVHYRIQCIFHATKTAPRWGQRGSTNIVRYPFSLLLRSIKTVSRDAE